MLSLSKRNPGRYGLLFILISTFFFTLVGIFVKLASIEIPTLTIVFWRSLIGVLIVCSLVRFNMGLLLGCGDTWWILLARGILGTFAIVTSFYSIKLTLISNAVALFYTYPVFAAILSKIFLKEKLPRFMVPIIIGSFIGMILITKPHLGTVRFGEVCGLLSGMFAGAAVTTIRYLRERENTYTIVFYFLAVTAVVTIIKHGSSQILHSPQGFLWLALIGVSATLGQFSMTYAYRFCRASEGSTLSLSSILLIMMAGYVFFGEMPDTLSILGTLLILIAGFAIFYEAKYSGQSP